MKLQSNLVRNIRAAYGENGDIWLQQLDAHLQQLSAQWEFRLIRELPDLSFSFVGLVELEATRELAIIKTAPKGDQIFFEVRCLQCFKNAIPKIYALDSEKNAILMEYLHPGSSLKALVKKGQDELATEIICKAICDLQTNQDRVFEFRHISELAQDLRFLKGHVEEYPITKAENLFHELSMDRSRDVVLHGDLHHDNIICHGTSWKVIDPHGYQGDPAAEVGAMIRNPIDCFPSHHPLSKIIETRLKIMCEQLSFDPQRIKAWTYCMTMLSAAWNVQDFNELSKTELELASIIDKIRV